MSNGPESQKWNMGKLGAELERQANDYHDLGVEKDSIMRLLTPRPDRWPQKLSIPVVTLGSSVEIERQLDFVCISSRIGLSSLHDVGGGITYPEPHLIWMQNGKKNLDVSVEWVYDHLQTNERPATLADGVAFAITHWANMRSILEDYVMVFPGSAIRINTEISSRPYLYSVLNRYLALDCRRVTNGYHNPAWGFATCGE